MMVHTKVLQNFAYIFPDEHLCMYRATDIANQSATHRNETPMYSLLEIKLEVPGS